MRSREKRRGLRSQLRVEPLERDRLGELLPLVERYPHLPFTCYPQITRSSNARLVIREIDRLLEGGGFCLVAEWKGEPAGIVTGQSLAWDTEQIQIPAGRLTHVIFWQPAAPIGPTVEEAALECRSRGIVHLSCRVSPEDVRAVHALERNGFELMEVLLTLGFRLGRDVPHIEPRGFVVEPVNVSEEEIQWMSRLTRTAFSLDRFHVDPYVPKERADALHAAWMENSCREDDVVLVARDRRSGEKVGFCSFKAHRSRPELLPTRFGNAVLGTVIPEARGRGVFTDITLAGLEWAGPEVDVLEKGTQFTNFQACRLYFAAGYRLMRSSVSFRKWMGPEHRET